MLSVIDTRIQIETRAFGGQCLAKSGLFSGNLWTADLSNHAWATRAAAKPLAKGSLHRQQCILPKDAGRSRN